MKGFTLVELLIAMTIVLLLAGALSHTTPAARAAFDRVPAELELQQRGRIVIDALSQALRAAERISVASPGDDGTYAELTAIMPIANAAQGVLSVDQPAPGGSMTLAATPCPSVSDLCGFSPGAVAMVSDGAGHVDVFIITSVNVVQRRITPNHALSRAYPAGSIVVEVEEHTFGLDLQPDESYSLIRVTAAGAVQPIADFISSLVFRVDGSHVDVELTAHAATSRAVVAEQVFKTSIAVRNVS